MAYFDNAATTYPKPECVYTFMDTFYRNSGGNVGRGDYSLAQDAGEMIMDTRKRIQNLLHCPDKQVIFTPTATMALNIILQGLIQKGIQHIYVSPFEHNAVTRLLHHFEKTGDLQVHKLCVSDEFEYDVERIRYQFDDIRPDLVVMSHASNVIGLIAPIEQIFELAKRYESYTVADMSQTAGLIDCNVGLTSFDFAVFAGHKTLYGPTGISGFVMLPNIDLPPVYFGGTGFESANQEMPSTLPERFEAGTLNVSGLAGLNAALRWHEETGSEIILDTEISNRQRLIELLNGFDFIKIIGNNPTQKYVGIVSCLIDGISSDSAGQIFDRFNIAVRTGLHCAPSAHKFLKTFPAGTIRFSIGYFTTEKDFEDLRDVLELIEEEL